jgi:hypothetical protein
LPIARHRHTPSLAEPGPLARRLKSIVHTPS